MPPRSRRENGEPLVVRAAVDRERHVTQVTSYGYFARRGPKRYVTVTPRPLRYWQYDPARPWVFVATALAVAAWLAFLGWRDGSAAVAGEAPLAIGLALVVVIGATARFTISDHAVSSDIAGLRQTSSFRVVPLVLISEVVPGRPPAGWPKARNRGGWWPGRRRISVRHLDLDGVTEKAFTVWVRDPAAVADALGRPLRD
ncbi:hypothetical protein [Modestobacter versicolor]|uniref:DUF3093 domain-containing protein n=1 Tax=Modestobacter versicolor TaxID=429133 RepID=A0A323VD30_9ACTN|nr:hypothetical protein [Modestobacter versicolor]MBB3675868.1 hypothetical protein [Modestobacter versicolor]PZA22812.1 hypothetical protein DMO24_03225 [Modestobacter versicolor]